MSVVNDPAIDLGKTLVQSLRTSGLSYDESVARSRQAGIEQWSFERMYVKFV